MKIVLFDCDDTLWNANGDYVSRLQSTFSISYKGVTRDVDSALFILKPGILDLIIDLHKNGSVIGIVSDNEEAAVLNVLTLFGIKPFLNNNAINIRLWNGHCPKETMVDEILAKPFANTIPRGEVLWIDDKDYSKVATKINVNFFNIKKRSLGELRRVLFS